MRISLNIHGNSIADRERLLRFLRDTHPRAVLVMDNLDLARQIKTLHPDMIVIFRAWPDDGIHLQQSAGVWVDRKAAEIGSEDIWLYANNEPGFSDEALNWCTQVVELAAAKGLKVVVGNFSAGTPNQDDWKRPAARKLLEALDKHRDTAICGLHEYAGGVITSGFIGGDPRFIQREDWPKTLTDVTMWHCGRFNFLLEACDFMAIAAPRIIITEHGFDNLSDIGDWLKSLVKTPPLEDIRGWKSLWNQWRVWWQINPEKAYAEQLIYADKTIYANTPVETQCIFSWGASSAQWNQFDIEHASELQALLIEYANPALPAPARKYEPNILYVYNGEDNRNIRTDAGLSSVAKGKLRTGDSVRFVNVDAKESDNLLWQRAVVFPSLGGLLEIDGWLAVTDLELDIKADEPPEEPPAPIELFTRTDLLRMAAIRAQIATLEAEYAGLWTKAAERAA